MAHARSELRVSQSQDSGHQCAILRVVRASLWYNAHLWSYCVIVDKSIWRKIHLGESPQLNGMQCCCVPSGRLGGNIARIKLATQLFRKTALQSQFSVSTSLFDTMPLYKSVHARHLFLSSFFLPFIGWHKSPFLFYNFQTFFKGNDFNNTHLVKQSLWLIHLRVWYKKQLKKHTTRTKNKQALPPTPCPCLVP